MPHSITENNLEEICAQCKRPHGNSIILEKFGSKFYEVITCQNCGYEIIRTISSKPPKDHFELLKRL
jgi:hypothetical protein